MCTLDAAGSMACPAQARLAAACTRRACLAVPLSEVVPFLDAHAQAKLAQLRAHAEDMVQSVLNNPKIHSAALQTLAEHERCAHACSRQGQHCLAGRHIPCHSLLYMHRRAAC